MRRLTVEHAADALIPPDKEVSKYPRAALPLLVSTAIKLIRLAALPAHITWPI